MGKRGPAPTPTKVLEMRGSWRAKANTGEPEPDERKPTCPTWLDSYAKAMWKHTVGQLDLMGLASKTDQTLLTRYCKQWSKWRKAEEFIDEHGDTYPVKDSDGKTIGVKEFPQVGRAANLSADLMKMEVQMGLTPSARARMVLPSDKTKKPNGEKDKSRFLKLG